jgi:hypothetical protein
VDDAMVRRAGASLIVGTILGTVGWVWAIQAQVSRNEADLDHSLPRVERHGEDLAAVKTDIAVIKERVTAQTAIVSGIDQKLDFLLLEARRANGR